MSPIPQAQGKQKSTYKEIINNRAVPLGLAALLLTSGYFYLSPDDPIIQTPVNAQELLEISNCSSIAYLANGAFTQYNRDEYKYGITPFDINSSEGYFMWCDDSKMLWVTGNEIERQKELTAGWNIISWGITEMNAEEVLSVYNLESIAYYDDSGFHQYNAKEYIYGITPFQMEMGKACFVYTVDAKTIKLPE